MRIDSVELINNSAITDAVLEFGITKPTGLNLDDKGRVFVLTATEGASSPGLYICKDGISWSLVNDNTGPLNAVDGSTSNASFGFLNDHSTGMYLPGNFELGFTVRNSKRLSITTSALTSTVSFYAPQAVAGLPAYSFTSDTNTGMYSSGLNVLDFATNAINRLSISTSLITSTLPFIAPAGSVSAPSYAFTGNANTGIYSGGAGVLNITTGGVNQLSITTTAINSSQTIRVPAGSATTPTFSFTSDSDSGIFSVSADVVGIVAGGVTRLSISNSSTTSSVPIRPSAGSVSVPSFSFTGDSDTGMYNSAVDEISFSTGGTDRVFVSNLAVSSFVPIRNVLGSASSPSYSFTGDTDSGIFSVSADVVGIVAGGTSRLVISTTTIVPYLPLRAPVGSAATPSFSFNSDADSGIYSGGADVLVVATGGANRLGVNNDKITTTVPVQVSDGSASNPTLSFANDTDTGLYASSVNTINIAAGGVKRFSIDSNKIQSQIPIQGFIGSVSAPTFSFIFDSGTGIYSSESNKVNICTSGSDILTINSTKFTLTTTEGLLPISFYFTRGTTDDNPFNTNTFFIANRAYKIIAARCVYLTAAGVSCTISLKRESGTSAPGSGSSVGTFNGNSTVNTVQTISSPTNATLAAGDRLSLSAPTIGSLNNMCVTVDLIPI